MPRYLTTVEGRWATYFEAVVTKGRQGAGKPTANWLMGDVSSTLNP